MESSKQYSQSIIFLIFFFISIIQAQVDTLWTKTFGGSGDDVASSVQQTIDEGYIIVGATKSFGAGGYDMWLIKTNAAGDSLWTKTFGGSNEDWGTLVQQTIDEGYIVTGTTSSFGAGDDDVWLLKTNADGDTLWTKTFGGSSLDWGNSVQQTADEGYIITGNTYSFGDGSKNIWLIKTNTSGDTLWTKLFGGDGYEGGYSVRQTTDGGYILTGYTGSFGAGSYDIWLIKTNAAGDTLWTKTFGGYAVDWGYSVQQISDEGFIIAGFTGSYGAGNWDIRLIKTNASGDTLWTKTFGGNGYEGGLSVQQTADEGYIMTGYTESFGAGGSDTWLIKTNAAGDTLWTKTYGGIGVDCGNSIQQTTNGGYIIAGSTSSFGAGEGDAWLIQTTPGVNKIIPDNGKTTSDYFICQNYPNPFNPSTTIEFDIPTSGFVSLKVFNVMGQEVATLVNKELSQGSHKVEWKPENLSSGLYFYKLETKGYQETKKLVLIK